MENIVDGSILEFQGSDERVYQREVMGVCGRVVFVRDILGAGTFTPPFYAEIQDLKTMGWVLKTA